MVSLVDIGKIRKKVPLRGQEIEVRGLSAAFIVNALASSEELRKLFAERGLEGADVMTLASQVPGMVAEAIAFATNKPGDEETIRFIMDELSPEEIVDILGAIIELSFPRGLRSFVDGLVQAARRSGLAVPGWDQAMNSQERSSSASKPVMRNIPLGDIPQGNSTDGSTSSEEKATSNSAA